MATTSRVKTWNSGDTLTAADLNAEFNNLLTGGINNIQDANVPVGAAIGEAKLAFNGSGHGHTGGTDGKLIAVNRGFGFFASGTQAVANDISWNPSADKAMTAVRLDAYARTAPTGAGLTVRIFNVTKSLAVASITIAAGSSTATAVTSMTNAAVAQDDVLRMDITAIGSTVAGADISAVLGCTQP